MRSCNQKDEERKFVMVMMMMTTTRRRRRKRSLKIFYTSLYIPNKLNLK
jgi:hypothetical protein